MGDTPTGPHHGKQPRQSGFGLRALLRSPRDNPAPGELQPTPQTLACQKVQDRRLAQIDRHGLDPAPPTEHTQTFVGELRGGLELPVQRLVRTRTGVERLLYLRLERNAILNGWGRLSMDVWGPVFSAAFPEAIRLLESIQAVLGKTVKGRGNEGGPTGEAVPVSIRELQSPFSFGITPGKPYQTKKP